MAPLTEVLALKSNELMSSSDNLRECVELLSKNIPGFQRSFWGDRLQEPGIRQWFIDWDEKPENYDPEVVQKANQKLQEVVSEFPKPKFVAFRTFPHTKCFTAPITEVIYATVKPDADLKEFAKVADVSLEVTEDYQGCFGTSWGYVVGSEREIMMVVGWDSIENHVNFTKTTEFKETTDPFLELVSDSGMFYVKNQSFRL
ncbi:hypothetical protein BJ138DRAFT_1108904 [Hygrophoropsis aurantiaca]|uniref:Uncharacterized protein n=1 Tax=Hygrophoropsis aurantiaca TaxID=72124 RepID=A0ACB8ASC3_9AGAM|nr:hypothetical protein BJ138DRAFT_1108904 [Hygrophoropsis aurantiaca]